MIQREDTDRLIILYQLYRSNMETIMDRRGMFISYFLSFLATVTGLVVVGISQFSDSKLIFIILIGPILNCVLCGLAKKISDSCYRTFLEAVTITAKVERIIGLTNIEGLCVVPERWLSVNKEVKPGRYNVDIMDEKFSTNEYVRDNLPRESNRILSLTFTSIQVINGLLAATILVVGIFPDIF